MSVLTRLKMVVKCIKIRGMLDGFVDMLPSRRAMLKIFVFACPTTTVNYMSVN